MTDNNKKRKKIIKISLIAIGIIAIIIVITSKANKQEIVQKQDTAILQRRTITNIITAAGKIKAENSKSVTSSSIGLKVSTINVKEGDKVEKGDLICAFDTSSITKQINDLKNNISKAKKDVENNKKNIDKAIEDSNKARDEQIKSIQKQMAETKKQIDNLEKEYKQAQETVKESQKSLDNYKKTYEEELKKYDTVKKEFEDKQAELTNEIEKYNKELGKQNLSNALNTTITQNALQESKEAKSKAEKELAELKSKYQEAEKNFKPINEKYTELEKAKENADTNSKRIKALLDTLNSTYDELNKKITSLKTNTTTNFSTSSTGESTIALLESQVDSLQKQLNNSRVYAPIAGTITSVNVSEGDTYIGSTIAKIEGMESYILEAQIDEYDIPDVKLGQEVKMKTEATRDMELTGIITYVAKSATEESSVLGDIAGISTGSFLGSSNNATYKIEASIDTETDRLRIGMNVKANIISEKKENVLSLPYDAIQEKDDGTRFIQIVKSKDEKTGELELEDIDVEVGLEGSYYSEVISDKIQAGMEVLIPKRDSDSSLQAILDSMGSGAGI